MFQIVWKTQLWGHFEPFLDIIVEMRSFPKTRALLVFHNIEPCDFKQQFRKT